MSTNSKYDYSELAEPKYDYSELGSDSAQPVTIGAPDQQPEESKPWDYTRYNIGSPMKPGLLSSALVASPAELGMAQGALNAGLAPYNLSAKGLTPLLNRMMDKDAEAPTAKFNFAPDTTMSKVGELLGGLTGFGALGKATKAIPIAEKAIASFPTLSSIAGGAAIGAAQDQDTGMGAAIGGGFGAIPGLPGAVKGLFKGGSKAIQYTGGKLGDMVGGKEVKAIQGAIDKINPDDTANTILQTLSKGKTVENNAVQGVKEIQKGFLNAKLNYINEKKPLMDNFGDIDLSDSDFNYGLNKNTALQKTLSTHLGDEPSLYRFMNKPNVRNGDILQSDINTAASNAWKKAQTSGDLTDYKALKNTRKILQDNISDSLTEQSSEAATKYSDLSDDYYNNVRSHLEDPTLSKIVEGDFNDFSEKYGKYSRELLNNENLKPKDITSFVRSGNINPIKAQSAIKSLQGSASLQEVFNNAPKVKNIITNSLLGGELKSGSAEKLLSNLNAIEQTNSQFISPKIKSLKDTLEDQISNKKELITNLNKSLENKYKNMKIAAGLGIAAIPGYEALKHYL